MLFHNHLVNIAQILEEETAMAQIRIHVLHCGKIGVAPNLPASAQWRWPAKADARRLKNDARIWLPVSAYLVEHPKGLFLVDAGLPRTVSPTGIEDRAAQLRMFGRGWYTLVHSVVEPGQSIGEQLAARGIRPRIWTMCSFPTSTRTTLRVSARCGAQSVCWWRRRNISGRAA